MIVVGVVVQRVIFGVKAWKIESQSAFQSGLDLIVVLLLALGQEVIGQFACVVGERAEASVPSSCGRLQRSRLNQRDNGGRTPFRHIVDESNGNIERFGQVWAREHAIFTEYVEGDFSKIINVEAARGRIPGYHD